MVNTWNMRTLFNPVIARILINGTNPLDLEYVLATVEATPLRHVHQLENVWYDLWNSRAESYYKRAESAAAQGSCITARTLYLYAAQCLFACFLINFSDIERKKKVYCDCAEYYEKSMNYFGYITKTTILVAPAMTLSAYVVAPPPGVPVVAGIAFFSGLGSSKEEMLGIALTFAERGILTVVPDMPGNGETLLVHQVVCSMRNLSMAYSAITGFCRTTTGGRVPVGVGGLCMGGGYALNATATEYHNEFCAALFPLFISETNDGCTPRWMTTGPWFECQTGGVLPAIFRAEMGYSAGDAIDCPVFIAHGTHDNWMDIAKIRRLFESVHNDKKKMVVIEDAPVYASADQVIHAMPVGEQLHWVKHIMADWVCKLVTYH